MVILFASEILMKHDIMLDFVYICYLFCRNYLSSVLIQQLFLTWDHDDLSLRAKAARILIVLLCKHEFDARYQKPEDKLHIAQLYFPLVGQCLLQNHEFVPWQSIF